MAPRWQLLPPVKLLLVLSLILTPTLGLAAARGNSLADRMDRVSKRWLEKPYLVDPLGEGPSGRFDRDPRLRLDGFDCTTFVETVIATAKSRSSSQVPGFMDRIRYSSARVGFETRNHFPDVDWIKNNTRAGFIRDVTNTVDAGALKTAEALIEKDNWYMLLPIERLSGIKDDKKLERLAELRSLSVRHGKEVSRVPYLDKNAIVAHPEILQKIPHGAVINVVRPNFDVTKAAGTHMNITHQGFAFHRDGKVIFRHASPTKDPVTGKGKVREQLLLDYVKDTVASPTIGGINVLVVL